MKFTKRELNDFRSHIACFIDDISDYNKLKSVCPDIANFDINNKYYLTSRNGSSESSYHKDMGNHYDYINITLNDIIDLPSFEYEIY